MTQTPKRKPVCPSCGSDDLNCDASAKWDGVAQKWDLTTTYDDMTCDSCGRETKEPDWVPLDPAPPASTRDLGFLIRDQIEDQTFSVFVNESAESHELVEHSLAAHVQFVDCSDPNNLIATLDDGAQFTIRVIAGRK